jgi:hypothetical protein
MAYKTNAQLLEELEEKDELLKEQGEAIKRLEEKTEILLAADTIAEETPERYRRTDHPEEGGGWLVKSPNEGFSGKVQGVHFTYGYGIVDEEQANSDMIVTRFENDYGYTVETLTPKQLIQMYKQLAKRETAEKPKQSMGEALAQTGNFGT